MYTTITIFLGTLVYTSSPLAQAFPNPIFLLSGEPDYFGRNKISSGGDLSHYSSAALY